MPMSCFNGTVRASSECCLAGTFWGGEHATLCVECPVGRFDGDNDPSTPCTDCRTGMFSDATGATHCDDCPAGSHSAAGSSTSSNCTDCALGQVDVDSDPSTPCIDCRTGMFSDVSGATHCDDCPAGSHSAAGSSTFSSCTDCALGQADVDSDPASPCTICRVGTYSDDGGATQCVACAANTSSLPGSSSCAFAVPTIDHATRVPLSMTSTLLARSDSSKRALSLRSCIYIGTHQLFPTRVLAQRSRL